MENQQQNTTQQQRGPKKGEWLTIHERLFPESGLMVRIQRYSIGRPKMTAQLGMMRDNKFTPFLAPEVLMGADDKASVDGKLAKGATKALYDAFEYIRAETQKDRDSYLERQKKLEALNQGKTARERESGKAGRREHNLAKRRAEDAARSHGGK